MAIALARNDYDRLSGHKQFHEISSGISSGDLPHVVELDIPRPKGAAEECLAYHDFKASKLV